MNNNDLILEITAGVGGQESMLFTAEMFEMYQSYAAFKDWHFEVLEYCHSELGRTVGSYRKLGVKPTTVMLLLSL